MSETKTNVTLLLPVELKQMLEQWSKEEDRSMSAVIRRMIEREAERRAAMKEQEQEVLES